MDKVCSLKGRAGGREPAQVPAKLPMGQMDINSIF